MRKVVTLKTALSYALALSLASGTALAAEASRAPAGTIDGAAIETLTLTNGQGVTAKILTYGATL
ncbi:MAG TPA: galactose-1-epimerase, partial [Sphingobium sp.]|nr:galactose-1-epimerase [Sphingobium sp.]